MSTSRDGQKLYAINYIQSFNNYKMDVYTIHAFKIEGSGSPSEFEFIGCLSADDYPIQMGFGTLGTSVYMIGGGKNALSSSGYYEFFPSLEVFILDMNLCNPNAPIAGFIEGPKLNSPKVSPMVVTVLGNIFVIQRSLSDRYELYEQAHVEVLRFGSNTWEVIPNIDTEDIACQVVTYDVVGSSIVMTLLSGSVYELDANCPELGWKERAGLDWLLRIGTIWRTGGSEIIDGLAYPWVSTNRFDSKTCYTAALDIAMENGFERDFISVRPPKNDQGLKRGPILIPGERRVLDCGGGRAVIFTCGFKRGDDVMGRGSGKYYFTIDIVDNFRAKRRRGGGIDNVIECNLVKSSSFSPGTTRAGHLCVCFIK